MICAKFTQVHLGDFVSSFLRKLDAILSFRLATTLEKPFGTPPPPCSCTRKSTDLNIFQKWNINLCHSSHLWIFKRSHWREPWFILVQHFNPRHSVGVWGAEGTWVDWHRPMMQREAQGDAAQNDLHKDSCRWSRKRFKRRNPIPKTVEIGHLRLQKLKLWKACKCNIKRNVIPMAEKPLCVPEVQITGPTRTVSRCQSAVRDPWDGSTHPGRRRLSVSKLRSQRWRTSVCSVEPKQDVRRRCDKMVIEQTLTQNLQEGFSYCSIY